MVELVGWGFLSLMKGDSHAQMLWMQTESRESRYDENMNIMAPFCSAWAEFIFAIKVAKLPPPLMLEVHTGRPDRLLVVQPLQTGEVPSQ